MGANVDRLVLLREDGHKGREFCIGYLPYHEMTMRILMSDELARSFSTTAYLFYAY